MRKLINVAVRGAVDRLGTAFRIFLVIPIAIVLGTVNGEGWQVSVPSHNYGATYVPALAGGLLFSGPLLMILFRRKYPRWWFDWNLELQRFTNRVTAYLALMDDRYPPPTITSRCTWTTATQMRRVSLTGGCR